MGQILPHGAAVTVRRCHIRALRADRTGVHGGNQCRPTEGVGLDPLYRAVFDQSPVGGVIVDAAVRIVETNWALQALLGREADELVGRDALALTHPDDRDRCRREVERLFAGEVDEFRIDKRFVHVDGHDVNVRLTACLVRDDAGEPLFGIGLAEDVSELAAAEAVYRVTLEAAPDAFIGIDGRGLVTDWNAAAEAMFGWSADEIVGERVVDHLFLRQDRAIYQEHIEAMSDPATGEVPEVRIELVAQRRDGETFPIELSMVVVTIEGRPRLRAFVRDITRRRAHERDLVERVLVDQVTGLANRTLLVDRLQQALARLVARGGHVGVLFCDLDRFRSVNESLGHSVGDALLGAVAARLQQAVGPTHTVARHGGDEFVVVADDLDRPEEAEAVAHRLLEAFSTPMAIAGHRLTLGVTVGVTATDDPDIDPDVLIRDADIAMHQAKMDGRGRVGVFDPALGSRVAGRLDLEQELRRAVNTGRIEVAYQPVVEFDGRIVSLEALARWDHPERGAVPPAEFIPLAEESGLIVDLGALVLDRACAQLAEWRGRPGWGDLTLAVNVSGRQLVEADLVSTVEQTLARHGLPVDALCLEITESMLMDDQSAAADAVDALAARGIVLAVDDFGTGYSSLLYLKRFPVAALKLDRSFVAGMGASPVDTAIVGSMIDLAHSLRLVAVAEGVETVAQAEALRARGCDLAQGYHWSRPLAPDALGLLLDEHGARVAEPA